MSIVDSWKDAATASGARVVLADVGDERAIDAARILTDAALLDAFVIDPEHHVDDEMRTLAATLGPTVDLDDPLHVATLLVKLGRADACVGGASRATADVIRAGIRILGVAPGVGAVSSCFLLVLADGRPVVYADCGVIPDPDVDQLAAIAIASAHTFTQLTGADPFVAMLSFSTLGSAEHARVDKMRSATRAARLLAPELVIDGELQFDAAFVPSIAASKAPGSPVAGHANTFVFPDLDSGNIAYKITERIGGAQAFGPLLQGLDGVLHDLSRGCLTDDIVNVALIAALQSRA